MGTKMMDDGQLAKAIYLRNMSAMKEVLTMGEFKIGNRQSDEYKYFKKVVMDQFYTSMLDLFESLEEKGVLMKCQCGTSIRQGYKPCPSCNGAGYCNASSLKNYMSGVKAMEQGLPEDEDIQPV